MTKNHPRFPLPRALLAAPGLLLAACVSISGPPEALSQESAASKEGFKPSTAVKIDRSFWVINGKRACQGTPAEGLLLNVRMPNATFEDRNPSTCPKGFDPDKNTAAFISRVPEYVSCGVRAFTLCLQGGPPGYEGAQSSTFEPDGSPRPEALARVSRAIEACDKAGAVVILGCFQPGQDQALKDEAAVRSAVVQTVRWIKEKGYTNVVLDVATEYSSKAYDHALLRDPGGVSELIRLAKETLPGLLVSSGGMGGGRVDRQVAIAADFVLLRFNNVLVGDILERVASADKVSKAIACNEDPKTGEEGAQALQAAVNAFCSWGFLNAKQNQEYPFKFEGAADDPVVYTKFKEVTTPGK